MGPRQKKKEMATAAQTKRRPGIKLRRSVLNVVILLKKIDRSLLAGNFP